MSEGLAFKSFFFVPMHTDQYTDITAIMSEGLAFKSFVSEAELNEKRQKRQEEWEKVRTADQPEGM